MLQILSQYYLYTSVTIFKRKFIVLLLEYAS